MLTNLLYSYKHNKYYSYITTTTGPTLYYYE